MDAVEVLVADGGGVVMVLARSPSGAVEENQRNVQRAQYK